MFSYFLCCIQGTNQLQQENSKTATFFNLFVSIFSAFKQIVIDASMEIFIKVRPIFLKLGLYEFSYSYGKLIKMVLRVVAMVALLSGASTSIIYVIFKVTNFAEYAETFVTVNMMTYSSLNYIAFLGRWNLFEKMIKNIQSKIIESS